MPEVSYTGNRLRIGNEEIELEYEIKDMVIVEDTIVVLQDPPPDENHQKTDDENVMAFDTEGNILWIIDPPPNGRDGRSYKHLVKKEGECLKVNNWNGYKYKLDSETGEVSDPDRFMKP